MRFSDCLQNCGDPWLTLRGAGGRRTGAAVNSHIVHQHGLRKGGGCVRTPRPAATYGDVEQHEKWMVVNPFRSLREIGRCPGRGQIVINIETDCVRLPFDAEGVKIVRKARVPRKAVWR